MQNLSRGGQQVWMSVEDAAKVGIADNDWIELVNRNGVVAARAIVSHRMPEGTVYMYHSQDRLIDVPLTETNGRRGGIHNSMTRILIKPSHIIGGYAQLAFAFNYLGPTGNNRDEVTMLRKRTAPPRVLTHPTSQGDEEHAHHGPDGDGDEPRQVHRVPHVLGDLQAGVDQPHRPGVRLVQQRRDAPRPGLPPAVRGPGDLEGRLGARPQRPAQAQGRRPPGQARHALQQPQAARDRGLLRALDVRLREPAERAGLQDVPGRPPALAAGRPPDEPAVGRQLGRRPGRHLRDRPRRPDAQGHRGEGHLRVRQVLHVLPAAHLRALPQPDVRGVLPLGRDLQARGGRHRPGRPEPLPRLAHVHLGLPVQEDLLQPLHRQGREVHLLLPARRGGHPDGVLRDLRGPPALHRPHALRRGRRHSPPPR